jgi:hypothetical protein
MPCILFRFLPGRMTVTVVIAAAVLFAAPITIQANGEAATTNVAAVDGWFPWQEGIGGPRTGVTSADMEAVVDHLEAIAQVLRRSESLTTGAEIRPSRSIGTGRTLGASQSGTVDYQLELRIHRPNLKESRSSGGKISLWVNSPYFAGDLLFADARGPIHLARPVVGEMANFPIHLLSEVRARARETGWVITSDGRSPWVPVSRERWIRALIGDARGKLDGFELEATEKSQQRHARFEHAY